MSEDTSLSMSRTAAGHEAPASSGLRWNQPQAHGAPTGIGTRFGTQMCQYWFDAVTHTTEEGGHDRTVRMSSRRTRNSKGTFLTARSPETKQAPLPLVASAMASAATEFRVSFSFRLAA